MKGAGATGNPRGGDSDMRSHLRAHIPQLLTILSETDDECQAVYVEAEHWYAVHQALGPFTNRIRLETCYPKTIQVYNITISGKTFDFRFIIRWGEDRQTDTTVFKDMETGRQYEWEYKRRKAYHTKKLRELDECKENWEYLHIHIPKLFPLLYWFRAEFLAAFAPEEHVEEIHRVLAPYTDKVEQRWEYHTEDPCWSFDLRVCGRPIGITLFLAGSWRSRVPQLK